MWLAAFTGAQFALPRLVLVIIIIVVVVIIILPQVGCWFVDRGFCPTRSCSQSVPKKYTEVYINHKLSGLLA